GDPLKMPARITWTTFSNDPDILAVADRQGNVGVWNLKDSRLLMPLLKLPAEVEQVEFSPDGRILATASGLTITFWDARTGLQLRQFQAHKNDILMIAYTADGQRLVTAAFNQPPKIWDVASGRMLGQPILAEQPHCYFQISPDGKRLATRSQSGVV